MKVSLVAPPDDANGTKALSVVVPVAVPCVALLTALTFIVERRPVVLVLSVRVSSPVPPPPSLPNSRAPGRRRRCRGPSGRAHTGLQSGARLSQRRGRPAGSPAWRVRHQI